MEISEANQLIALYGNRLPMESMELIRKKLLGMDYNMASIRMAQFKDPTLTLILSVLVGSLGVDRFYIGDVGLGVGKLLTCGGAYVWWLVDLFMIQDATKRKKYGNVYDVWISNLHLIKTINSNFKNRVLWKKKK